MVVSKNSTWPWEEAGGCVPEGGGTTVVSKIASTGTREEGGGTSVVSRIGSTGTLEEGGGTIVVSRISTGATVGEATGVEGTVAGADWALFCRRSIEGVWRGG